MFSNAKNCNSYNKTFGDVKFIDNFLLKDYEKLEESSRFPQFSYFDGKEEDDKETENNQAKTSTIINDSKFSNCLLSKINIEKFFAPDFEQQKEHSLEESVCKPLIGKQKSEPFFYYCKQHPDVENIHLKASRTT